MDARSIEQIRKTFQYETFASILEDTRLCDAIAQAFDETAAESDTVVATLVNIEMAIARTHTATCGFAIAFLCGKYAERNEARRLANALGATSTPNAFIDNALATRFHKLREAVQELRDMEAQLTNSHIPSAKAIDSLVDMQVTTMYQLYFVI